MKTNELFTIARDDQSGWTVTNTKSGIVIGSHWFREGALQQVAEVEARIAAKRDRDQALYLYV